MKQIYRYLITQIWNERRSNIALLLELFIIACIMFIIVDAGWCMHLLYSEPMGSDISHCYQLETKFFGEDSPYYDTSPDGESVKYETRMNLLEMVRNDEDVEYAAYSMGCAPYNLSAMISGYAIDSTFVSARLVVCQPDFVHLFRLQSQSGMTAQQMADALEKNEVLISSNLVEGDSARHLVGKMLSAWDGKHRVAGLVQPLKRIEREGLDNECSKAYIFRLERGDIENGWLDFSVRVKAGRDRQFEERIRRQIKDRELRVGNLFVSGVKRYETLREEIMAQDRTTLQMPLMIGGFLLFNVFLGLLGTFWFRTQQRFPEIGLQKAMGATRSDVALRLMCEAVILLSIAFLPSILIDYNLAVRGVTRLYNGLTFEGGRFCITLGLTYLILLLVILVGIWFPTRQAARTNPIDVLRNE
jgi:putative ABC transport system permease protein